MSPRFFHTDTSELAVKKPLPAAAGTPMPGYVERPPPESSTPVAGPARDPRRTGYAASCRFPVRTSLCVSARTFAG